MKTLWLPRVLAWGIALTLIALPIVGVLNGWFAADRWPVRQLAVHGGFDHVSAEQIRATASIHLHDGFFAVDLAALREAVARLPWVERVEARKRWPDTIELSVYEQQPWVRWGADRLVNRRGEVFAAPGAAAIQGLARLSGPDERVSDVLAFYIDAMKKFAHSGLAVEGVRLSTRGSWSLALSNDAVIEIGRKHPAARLQRFLDVWPKLAVGRADPPTYVDLRYSNGFAVRWLPLTAPADVPPESGVPSASQKVPG